MTSGVDYTKTATTPAYNLLAEARLALTWTLAVIPVDRMVYRALVAITKEGHFTPAVGLVMDCEGVPLDQLEELAQNHSAWHATVSALA